LPILPEAGTLARPLGYVGAVGQAARKRSLRRATGGAYPEGLMDQPQGSTYQVPLAGVFTRFLAVLIDGLIVIVLMIPGGIISFAGQASGSTDTGIMLAIFGGLLSMVLTLAYLAYTFVLWTRGQTPGKRMLGIQVIKTDTLQPARFWRMALREIIGKWISAVICYLGFIWAFIDGNKQAWHDKIAGTLVVATNR
jgi:uncharacterized RDD family membrane protein YckC